uniref:Uncharacterized protein n=1 Tax=Craspedostauros australis TaxID=1486917 RepID=A0A7R9WM87_9STRA
MFSWLVASSAKVEAQLQMVKRRCSQYGLNLTTFPHISVSEDPFLNAFVVPPSICIKDAAVADQIDDALANSVFVNDGVYFTKSSVLSCIDGSEDYDFSRARAPRNKKKADDENKKSAGVRLTRISSRQFVHRSGSMFVRKLRDQKGWVILVVIPNTQHSSRHDLPKYRRMLRSSFLELCRIIEDLKQQHQRRQREKEKEQEQAQKRERETIQVQKKEREVEQEQALKGMGSTGASGSANDNANISANTNAKAEAEADHRPSALTTRTTDDVAIDTSRKEAKVEE